MRPSPLEVDSSEPRAPRSRGRFCVLTALDANAVVAFNREGGECVDFFDQGLILISSSGVISRTRLSTRTAVGRRRAPSGARR
jgi:hypothetical protein